MPEQIELAQRFLLPPPRLFLIVALAGATKRNLRLGKLANGGAKQFAPAVEGAVEIHRGFGDDGLQPCLAEPARIGERREIKLQDAPGAFAHFVLRRFGKLNRRFRLRPSLAIVARRRY